MRGNAGKGRSLPTGTATKEPSMHKILLVIGLAAGLAACGN